MDLNLARRPRAGRSAQDRYDGMAKAWRKRVLGRVRWVVWGVTALSVLGVKAPGPWGYVAGLLGGAAIAFWAAADQMVPQHIQNWWLGAEGERDTEKELRRLQRDGWVIEHDILGARGNVDHLVLGPPGVFLLDSKLWGGQVHVTGDVATVTPIENPDAAWSYPGLAAAMRGKSAETHDELNRKANVSTWVNPVVVVWAPFDQGVVQANGLAYVHGERIASWLESQPAKLSAEQLSQLAPFIRTDRTLRRRHART